MILHHSRFLLALIFNPLLGGFLPTSTSAATPLRLISPLDYEVRQRDATGQGSIAVAGALPQPAEAPVVIETRLVVDPGEADWQRLASIAAGGSEFRGELQAPAGGWYRLEVRAVRGKSVAAEAVVEHLGVGEVFAVAGQSNSANHGSEKQTPRTGLVSAFDGAKWQLANDPQPGASGGGGSFLAPFGDTLAERFKVPIGIVATGVGATSVREWLPAGTRFPKPPTLVGNVAPLLSGEWEAKGTIYHRFTTRLRALGPHGFRAVLWHQGESDANQRDATRTLPGDLYRDYLSQVIRDSRRDLGWEAPWFVAQVSYHTPDDPGSPDIRAAQKAVWDSGLALAGPDSDSLTGKLRERDGKGVHFSGPGLRAHATLWVEKVAPWLEQQLAKSPGPSAKEPRGR